MRTSESAQMIEELYSEICKAIMLGNQSGDASPSIEFASLTIPGTVVDASDFDRSASQDRDYLLAYMDQLSAASRKYGGSTRYCNDLYAQTVSAIQPENGPDRAGEKDAARDETHDEKDV